MQTYRLMPTSKAVPLIDGEALLARNVAELQDAMNRLSFRCTITILVTQGEAVWSSLPENPEQGSAETETLTKGDLLIHNVAKAKCEVTAQTGFAMVALCVSTEFNREFSQMVKISWKIRQALLTNALYHLSAEDRRHTEENFDFLLMKCSDSDFEHREVINKHLLHILSVEVLLRLERYITSSGPDPTSTTAKNPDVTMGNTTSAQIIYNRFASMLEGTAVRNRPVSWWAMQLCITPKYLSAVCREVEGKSARSLIAESVIQEAIRLLQDSELSVKEVSERLGFVNQSHFGTFFRRHTGHSPHK